MRDTLRDAAVSGLLLVTTGEELPVIETIEMLLQLEAEPVIDLVGLVVNRVLAPLEISGPTDAIANGPRRDAALLHASLVAEQHEWTRQLPEHTELPFLFGLRTAGEVAAQLADLWESP